MDIHEIGKELVKFIIHRKRMALYFAGIPECELCINPRPGTESTVCPAGCEHRLCLRCKEEIEIRRTAMLDQMAAEAREHIKAQKQEWLERQRWASQN
jgi:ribosome-binding protein aMBF1 (putative translation factor)